MLRRIAASHTGSFVEPLGDTMGGSVDFVALHASRPERYPFLLQSTASDGRLGRFDRAWGPERPVFGKVRYMTSESTRRAPSTTGTSAGRTGSTRRGMRLAHMSANGVVRPGCEPR